MSAPIVAPTCYRHPDRPTLISCQRCGRPICPECMTAAPVGFHCPECVAEGVRATRSDRAPFGGRRSRNPTLTSLALIAVNALVWLAVVGTGGDRSPLVWQLALRSVGECRLVADPTRWFPFADRAACSSAQGMMWLAGLADGGWWQVITSAFVHVDAIHIASNMITLWFLGPQLEATLGRVRFLALYLLSGLAGSVAVVWLSPPGTWTIGASGAIFGLLGALLIVAYRVKGNVQGILAWLGINVAITVVGRSFISWQGHLGGLLGGLLVAWLLVHAPRERRVAVQWRGMAVVAALLLAAVVIRAWQLSAR